MARTATALAAVTLALILAGCSSPATTTGAAQAGSTPAVTSTTPASGAKGGSVDCTALSGDAGATYIVGIQLLAQLTTQDSVDSLKAGVLNYDPDAMGAILVKLKSLAGHSILGDPGPDVDFYIQANDMAREILAVSGPVPQDKFDALKALEGDPGSFLGHQLSINAAYDDACG